MGRRRARLEWLVAGLRGRRPVPFILLSSARSGNNMIRTAVQQHPDVSFGNEFYLFAQSARLEHLVPPDLLTVLRKDPELGCVRMFQGRPGCRAAGFTLLYFHMREPEQLRLWTFLADFPRLRVIDLQRRNRFLQWLSLKEAMHHDSWLTTVDQPMPVRKPLELQADEFGAWLEEGRRDRDFALGHMTRHERLDVWYEDLVSDFRTQSRRIMRFLDLRELDLPPWSRKTGVQPLRERIAGFDAFAIAMAGKPGDRYFREALEDEKAGRVT